MTKEEYLYCYGNIRDAMKKICLSCQEDERCKGCDIFNDLHNFRKIIHEHFELVEKIKTGELSDGYHTFNELYYHRAVLFSVICNSHKDIAWKSKKHHDGTMYNDMFIVGIDTAQGQYSYHYDMNIWSMFDVKELEYAPKWDGHKPSDIERLRGIEKPQPYKFIDLKASMFVFDCIKNRVNKIIEIFEADYGIPYIKFDDGFGEWFIVAFEEGRFFSVTKALEYQK